MAVVAKTLLVMVTMVCLLSMGGAMLFAFPVIVPLLWRATRDSGPYATAGWTLLAALSMFEAGWMLTYVVSHNEGIGLLIGLVAAAATVAGFLRGAADRAATASALPR